MAFFIAIPLGLLDGVVAFALKPYMDYVVGQKNLEFALFNHNFSISYSLMAVAIPFAVVLFAGFQGILRYLNEYLSSWISQKITNGVKIDLFSRLVYMNTSFYDENPSGVVLTRYLNDPNTAATSIVDNIRTLIVSSFGALSLVGVMLYSSWKLAIIGVIVLCVAFVPVFLIRKRVKKASNENMKIGGDITTNFNETYSGHKVMSSYGLEKRQQKLFIDKVHESFNVNMSLIKRAGWMSPLMYLIASMGIALVLGYGTQLIISNQMTAGSFASFVTSLLLLYKPIKTLGGTLTGLQSVFVAMGRVFELFDYETEIKEKENAVVLTSINNNITFEHVDFEYVKGNKILCDFNLEVKKNETLALVGNSGGGKSTLVNLLPRFYDVTNGAIKIDGVDIRDFTLESLRKNIAFVFQDNFLFSGTIRENILMGKFDANEEELNKAIHYAHLEEMLEELPNGLETILGERGMTLSGGQRQRVAIARAMIKDAPIIVLDEATSALDNKSEAIVQKALDNLIKNKTVFVIAHRLSTIKNANRIAVINEGKLVELGSHDELLNIPNGQYKFLYEMQFNEKQTPVLP
ncbi:MAG: ABC transporter ATP-binding protein/permease [Candidatus Gastranaerophilales bacterium]|nr:ABC transporter ATP-binding protein/permease [Candidatus Gastranaerophilales bacterium]